MLRSISSLVAIMAFAVTAAAPSAPSPATSVLRERGAVALDRNTLLRDGRPWVPQGVVQIAFVAPPAAQEGVFKAAYHNYSPNHYNEMRRFGIDSVRIQMSQPGLDPQDRLFDAAFRDRLISAVRAARAVGLTVLLSVQDEAQSGDPTPARLPDDGTRRVWREMAPLFANDAGVMYELLNEPQPAGTPQNWRAWREAMNATITVVRRAGARNVVIADGLLSGERLSGAPSLDDPLRLVVYASHPYAHGAAGLTGADWDRKFGNFAQTHPVIVTEWTTSHNFYCDAATAVSTRRFLAYLKGRRIGLMAFAWDFSGTRFGSAFQGFPPQPTAYGQRRCGDEGFGPGADIVNVYTSR